MAETKETIIVELKIEDGSGGKAAPQLKKEIEAAAGSILGLQQANKKLREERNKLDPVDAAQAKRIKEINGLLDQNNAKIKDNSSTLEKQRLNIGNYASALDRLVPGLGGAVEGIQGMTKASYAFIATGIGAIIAALGLALAAVIAYFKRSEEGADKFAKVAAQAQAVIGVLVDRVIMLGGAIVAFLSGDFTGGLKKLEGAFSGVGDEIAREVELAGELADILDELEERELRYALAVSETANQIKRLIIEAKNRTLTEEQRIAKLNEAIALEKKSNEQALKLQEDRIDATARQIQADFSQFESAKKAGESAIDFAKRIVANEGIMFDKRKELADLLIAYNGTQGESLNIQEKINNQTDTLNEKLEERIKKQRELNEEVARYLELFQQQLDANYAAFVAEEMQANERSKMSERFIEETNAQTTASTNLSKIRIQAAKNAADSEARFNKTSNELKAKQDTEYAKTAAKLAGDAAALFRENTIAFKVLATGRAIANTFLGVTEILKTPSVLPEPAATIARGLSIGVAIGSGLKAVAEINKVKFAQGGMVDFAGPKLAKGGHFKVGGRPHSQGGTKYYGEDGNQFEVERGEGIYVMKRDAEEVAHLSAHNMRHGGRSWEPRGSYPAMQSFALGGSIPTASPQRGLTAADVRDIVAGMPAPIVTVEDINTGQANRAEVTDKANII